MTDTMVASGTTISSPEDLASLRDQLAAAAEGRRRVLVCSTGCLAIGAREVEATEEALAHYREAIGRKFLDYGYIAIVYGRNRVKYIPDVISKTVMNGEIIRRFCYGRDAEMAHVEDIPFYAHQTKRVLRNVGRVDPGVSFKNYGMDRMVMDVCLMVKGVSGKAWTEGEFDLLGHIF